MAVSDIRLCWDTNLFRNFYWNIRHWSARSYSLGSYMVRCTGLHTKAFCCVLNESFFNILFGAQRLEAGGGESMGGKNWSYAAPEFSQRRANTEPWSTGSLLPQRGGRTEVQVPHRISFCIGLWNVSVPGAQNARFQRTGLPKGADDMALSRSSAATQGDLVGVQWPVPPRWIGDSFLIPGSSARGLENPHHCLLSCPSFTLLFLLLHGLSQGAKSCEAWNIQFLSLCGIISISHALCFLWAQQKQGA